MESKFSGFDSTDLKFSFRHPRAANTLTEFSTLFDAKTRQIVPKIVVSHAFAKCKLSGSVSLMPSDCEKSSCCLLSRAKCDVSAVIDYPKVRAGVKLIAANISNPSDLVHYYAACYTEGPVTSTLSSNSLKDFKGSLIYEHDHAHSFGVQAIYDVSSKAYKSHFAFSKEVKKDTMFTVLFFMGRISSDLSAQINIEHRIDENLSFSISNEFALDDINKPSKIGFGLEITT
ncbi:hypothetical protein MXB_4460 [Myxobolus squamalis]|nr:hypothetical protein MXB_4460 [Myxobolus squamalis]